MLIKGLTIYKAEYFCFIGIARFNNVQNAMNF